MPASRGGGRLTFRVKPLHVQYQVRIWEGNTKKVHRCISRTQKGYYSPLALPAGRRQLGPGYHLAAEALGSAAARRDARPRHRARAAAPLGRRAGGGERAAGRRVQTELLQIGWGE